VGALSDLKRTELRHRLLAAIAAGKVDRAKTGGRTWDIRTDVSTYGAMEKAVEYFIHGDAAKIDRNAGWSFGGPIVLTDTGRALLSEWNDRYGEVQP
jgi:hypothetical protein